MMAGMMDDKEKHRFNNAAQRGELSVDAPTPANHTPYLQGAGRHRPMRGQQGGGTSTSMSTAEGADQREEGEYGRAAKRLKTEEREEGEEELEEGEDSDSGSLP
ncbi:hypothetical protein INR49_023078, partial [Caranx melampygus]